MHADSLAGRTMAQRLCRTACQNSAHFCCIQRGQASWATACTQQPQAICPKRGFFCRCSLYCCHRVITSLGRCLRNERQCGFPRPNDALWNGEACVTCNARAYVLIVLQELVTMQLTSCKRCRACWVGVVSLLKEMIQSGDYLSEHPQAPNFSYSCFPKRG